MWAGQKAWDSKFQNVPVRVKETCRCIPLRLGRQSQAGVYSVAVVYSHMITSHKTNICLFMLGLVSGWYNVTREHVKSCIYVPVSVHTW